jgi:undecaprenyl-phosphate 4-deoxy-4-formamido-L-arabinose transferase
MIPREENPGKMASSRLPDLTIVVPVYNSENSLALLVERILAALPDRAVEIILVNDGSRDGSWPKIEELTRSFPQVLGIRLMRNYGQHNALLAGIRRAGAPVIVTIDDDLQHRPEDIPLLVAELEKGNAVVYGTPRKLPHTPFRNLSSWISKIALERAMGAEMARKVSAYRCFRTEIRRAFDSYQSPYVSIDVLLTWGTTSFSSVQVEHQSRTIGQSNYNLRKLGVHLLTMMTGFSTWPLRAASIIGFCFTLIGIAVLMWVLVNYIVHHGSVPGFPFLASIIAIFSGAQMFALGIMGEYLARIHVRTTDRTPYTIAEQVSTGSDEGVR